jgi:hypothetical protein
VKQALMRGRSKSTSILDVSIRQKWVINAMPQPLYPLRKEAWYKLYTRLSGPSGWSGGVRKISPQLWAWNLDHPSVVSCYTNYSIPASLYANIMWCPDMVTNLSTNNTPGCLTVVNEIVWNMNNISLLYNLMMAWILPKHAAVFS